MSKDQRSLSNGHSASLQAFLHALGTCLIALNGTEPKQKLSCAWVVSILDLPVTPELVPVVISLRCELERFVQAAEGDEAQKRILAEEFRYLKLGQVLVLSGLPVRDLNIFCLISNDVLLPDEAAEAFGLTRMRIDQIIRTVGERCGVPHERKQRVIGIHQTNPREQTLPKTFPCKGCTDKCPRVSDGCAKLGHELQGLDHHDEAEGVGPEGNENADGPMEEVFEKWRVEENNLTNRLQLSIMAEDIQAFLNAHEAVTNAYLRKYGGGINVKIEKEHQTWVKENAGQFSKIGWMAKKTRKNRRS